VQSKFAEAGAEEPPGGEAKHCISKKAKPNPKIKVEFPAQLIGAVQHKPNVRDCHNGEPEHPGEYKDSENGVDAGLIGVFGGEG